MDVSPRPPKKHRLLWVVALIVLLLAAVLFLTFTLDRAPSPKVEETVGISRPSPSPQPSTGAVPELPAPTSPPDEATPRHDGPDNPVANDTQAVPEAPIPQSSRPVPSLPNTGPRPTAPRSPASTSSRPVPSLPTSLPVTEVPQFPWPPPASSAREVLPRNLLRGAYLADIDRFLSKALYKSGYAETSYYAVPSGFALVTRLEQIELDGRSKVPPDRWSAGAPAQMTHFSVGAYVNALFTADPGHYRVVVFVVTNVPFRQSDKQISRAEALGWLRDGLNVLPPIIGEQRYTADVNCTALIYEFERKGDTTRILLPSGLDAHTHLIKSGLWSAVEGG
jgi:hypothetical protein